MKSELYNDLRKPSLSRERNEVNHANTDAAEESFDLSAAAPTTQPQPATATTHTKHSYSANDPSRNPLWLKAFNVFMAIMLAVTMFNAQGLTTISQAWAENAASSSQQTSSSQSESSASSSSSSTSSESSEQSQSSSQSSSSQAESQTTSSSNLLDDLLNPNAQQSSENKPSENNPTGGGFF